MNRPNPEPDAGVDTEEHARRVEAYKAKVDARLDRMRSRAERLARHGASQVEQAKRMADVIPFGQPILVGHYSEGRDRNYRGRIDKKFTKGFEAMGEARELERKADAAENNADRTVSSDDPDAVRKLRSKLAEIESLRVSGRAINKIIQAARRKLKDLPPMTPDERAAYAKANPPETQAWYLQASKALQQAGHSEKLIKAALAPDFAGRYGMADYKLTNLGAEARRLEARIKALEASAKAPVAEPVVVGEGEAAVRIEEVLDENRIRLVFQKKPSEEARKVLKSRGFRWSPTAGAWQRQLTNAARYDAKDVVRIVLEKGP
jgi:hypothetical protein